MSRLCLNFVIISGIVGIWSLVSSTSLSTIVYSAESTNPYAEYIYINEGTFAMGTYYGADDARPEHIVTLKAFYFHQFEVSTEKYIAFLNKNSEKIKDKYQAYIDINNPKSYIKLNDSSFTASNIVYKNHPIILVSWWGAEKYCESIDARLPTEAEWEYTARLTGKKFIYPWGSEFSENLLNSQWLQLSASMKMSELSQGRGTLPVGVMLPSLIGIYDIAGNVAEWCYDWYDQDYYKTGTLNNPKGFDSGIYKSVRGGSWADWDTDAFKTSTRSKAKPYTMSTSIGFRCVRQK